MARAILRQAGLLLALVTFLAGVLSPVASMAAVPALAQGDTQPSIVAADCADCDCDCATGCVSAAPCNASSGQCSSLRGCSSPNVALFDGAYHPLSSSKSILHPALLDTRHGQALTPDLRPPIFSA